MGIYTRDQIQYANMIQNALQNRARDIERKYDAFAKRGEMYGNAARNIGNTISDAFMKYATYADNQEAAQLQRDFQASEALKRAQEQKEAQEAQRKWQEEQNRLSRESTERIAGLNRTATIANANSEKQALAIMKVGIQQDTLDRLYDELERTDDPSRKAQLYGKMDEARRLIAYYSEDLPEALKPQTVGSKWNGPVEFQRGMGRKPVTSATPLQGSNTPTDVPAMQSENVAKFTADLSNAKTSTDAQTALDGLNKIDISKLDKSGRDSLQKTIADGEAKLSQLKKSEESRANEKKNVMGWANPGDPLPSGWFVRSIEGKKVPMKKINGIWKTREEVYQ